MAGTYVEQVCDNCPIPLQIVITIGMGIGLYQFSHVLFWCVIGGYATAGIGYLLWWLLIDKED